MDDVVIEFKVRLSGLSYDEAQKVRDVLRNERDESTVVIVEEIHALAQEIAPEAKIWWTSPWAEWRPARGRKR